jgi:flagellar basal-body rod protein FlgC
MTTIDSSRPQAPVLQPPRLPAEGAARPLFRVLAVAASGLSAQRARMEVAAQNIANSETTRTAQGGPYRRKTVALESAAEPTTFPSGPNMSALAYIADGSDSFGAAARSIMPGIPALDPMDAGGVRVAGIGEDGSEGPLVYDPGHPDANEKGYVRMPNVRVTDEMMEMMDARRVYDANATVFQSAKAMLRRALDL